MTIHKVLVPKDFIPMGERTTKIICVYIDFKTPLQDEKLKLALETAGFSTVTKIVYRKLIDCEEDISIFFDFHNEWIFTLCEMFLCFTMSYYFAFTECTGESHHKLDFSGVMEYSVFKCLID